MIVRYSALQLTYESDRLPALSGLAKQFAESLHGKVRYLAGLWENDLWRGLGWASHANTRRSKSLTLPSWSWISMKYLNDAERRLQPHPPDQFWKGVFFSWDGGEFEHLIVDKHLQLLVISGLEEDSAFSFMQAEGLSLKIRGVCVTSKSVPMDQYRLLNADIFWDSREETLENKANVVFLLLGIVREGSEAESTMDESYRFLVLESSSAPEKFRRIGTGWTSLTWPGEKQMFDDGKILDIELV